MDRALLEIHTTLKAGDYRGCLFSGTFKTNRGYAFLLVACCFIFSMMYGNTFNGALDVQKFVKAFVFLLVLVFLACVAAVLVNCEYRIHTRMAEKLGRVKVMRFYDEYMEREYPDLNDARTIYYDQIYRVVRSKNYIALYYTATAMSAIRRRDMAPQEWDALIGLLSRKCSYNG